MTTTILVWAPETPDSAASTSLNNHAAEMQLAGKTDNDPVKVEVPAGLQVTRTWTTLADAEEWILYAEQFTPVSATIQS
jgi:hypothetical protein